MYEFLTNIFVFGPGMNMGIAFLGYTGLFVLACSFVRNIAMRVKRWGAKRGF